MGFFKTFEEKIEIEKGRQAVIKQKQLEEQKKIADRKKFEEEREGTYKAFSMMKRNRIGLTKSITNRIKDKFLASKTMLIHMELTNGFHMQFIAVIYNNKFVFQKGIYIVDDDLKYYDMTSKLWCLDYHEGLTIPVKRKVPLGKIKKIILAKGISDVDTAINPITLKQFIESEVIQKVMKGEEMDRVFKFIKLMLILIFVITLITALIIIQSSGMLSGLRLPF